MHSLFFICPARMVLKVVDYRSVYKKGKSKQ